MKTVLNLENSLEKLARFLWGAALFTLPVTSFRYFPFLGETTYVRPLAFYPIAFLIPLLLIQTLRGKSSLLRAFRAFIFCIKAPARFCWLAEL